MRVHRFYTGPDLRLSQDLWLHDVKLLHQWRKVLRLKAGDEVVLFDGQTVDRLYKVIELNDREANLHMVTELSRKVPPREIYLFWALLKKDKNEWVLQKATELGVSHFVPLLADRSEKIGFNVDRAQKIVIEAAEQCGRSDIPSVREPIHTESALTEFNVRIPLYVCEQEGEEWVSTIDRAGILVGPEGGWSDREKELFTRDGIKHLNLHHFTLRAETAAVAAVTRLL